MKRNLIVFALFALLATTVLATPPRTMSYQGVLTDNLGVVVPDGVYPMTFRIYDDPNAGTMLWEESQNVTVTSGRFNVILGSLDGLSFDNPYWLAIKVDTDPEMTPRTELAGAPYSLTARTVEDNAITNSKIANGTVVRSVNGLHDNVNLLAGANITITPVGNDLEISSSGAGSDGDWTITGNDLVSAVSGEVGIGVVPSSKLDVVHTSIDDVFSIRAQNSTGTAAGFYSKAAATPYPSNPTALYSRGENGAYGAFLTSAGAGHGVIAQSNGSGRALWGWAFGSGYAGYFTGGQGVFMESNLDVGSETGLSGNIELFRTGSSFSVAQVFTGPGGGQIVMRDEFGGSTNSITYDASIGGGGDITVYRDDLSNTGIDLNGNWAGSQSSRVSIFGTASSIVLTTDVTGDASVQVPTNAISASEALDEPGVAALAQNVSTVLSLGINVISSRTITAPASGYVMVIASAQFHAQHTSGTYSNAFFGVSDNSTSFPDNQDFQHLIPITAVSGGYGSSVTVHGLFQVGSGSHTFYFLARESSGDHTVNDRQLTLVYLPTAYGTVTPTFAAGPSVPDDQVPRRGALTQAELAVERAESKAFNDARVARELDDMRTRIERLEAELAAERAGQ